MSSTGKIFMYKRVSLPDFDGPEFALLSCSSGVSGFGVCVARLARDAAHPTRGAQSLPPIATRRRMIPPIIVSCQRLRAANVDEQLAAVPGRLAVGSCQCPPVTVDRADADFCDRGPPPNPAGFVKPRRMTSPAHDPLAVKICSR